VFMARAADCTETCAIVKPGTQSSTAAREEHRPNLR